MHDMLTVERQSLVGAMYLFLIYLQNVIRQAMGRVKIWAKYFKFNTILAMLLLLAIGNIKLLVVLIPHPPPALLPPS